jgi:phosphatidylglycerophosphatase A
MLFGRLLGLSALLMALASIAASGAVVRRSESKDPGHVVSDEWAGMWLALWPARRLVSDALGGGGWAPAAAAMLAAFLLFRLLDIWKPPPVGSLERLPGGWGVTMDDVAAGILAGLAVQCMLAAWSVLGA